MMLALGICAALFARSTGGAGQVIDAAMVDGAGLLTSMAHGMRATGEWTDERQANLLDGGAHFYRTYETADGRYVAVGAIEPQFYGALLEGLGIDAGELGAQYDRKAWPLARERLAAIFRTRTRDEWVDVFSGTDACVAPVNDLGEAATDQHMVGRGSFVEIEGVVQPAPAPRFSGWDLPVPTPPRPPGADTDDVLARLGYSPESISELHRRGVVA